MIFSKKNMKTLWELAKNDFATRFAGSFFGIVWAFIQPLVLILMYMFVFTVAIPATPMGDKYPYVLWLVAGLAPWFFFSEAVVNATNCLIEYSYLVKKVVFPINILPFVKILSSLFVHLFFIVVTLIISAVVGNFPGLFFIQIVYYLFCLILLISVIGFFTSSVLPFFRDFMPIVSIFMQVGMWYTPILWDIERLKDYPVLMLIMKINPVAYIVNGYRETYLGIGWFWENPSYMLSFWCQVLILGIIGTASFRKMLPHFADVL
ncbi:ABC transporter permease [Butyrivibrio sp. AE2005]|uniref:ABC transporter permease n=1 Tax=Butyrivibrio sp. AE2005 TaxID=1496722 RepID=UPI00054FB42C|nr:ABC transporter permease [Butyrivibrio sp. AE2005]